MMADPTKASRFNARTTLADGTDLLFNFATLSLVALEPRAAHKTRRILEQPRSEAGVRGHRRLARLLEKNGFLVPEGEDELARLRAAFGERKAPSNVLSVTVVPTLACNFDCVYCCQGRTHSGHMTGEVEEALAAFVASRLVREGTLAVTWYGGEPLLAKPTIDRLSRRFLELSGERGARYQAVIITNGFLLDEPTARWLQRSGVKAAQVTLDGPPEVHDRRRPSSTGGPTFGRILKNIRSACEILEVWIRTNVDDDNRSSVAPLLDGLVSAGIAHRVSHYTAPVTAVGTVCPNLSGRCLDTGAFSLARLEASVELTRRNLIDRWRPRLVTAPCSATCGDAFVVAPDGGLVTCWEEVGRPDRYVGHLLQPQTEAMAANRRWWLEYDPFAFACGECQVLPICMSHCPYQVRERGTLPCPGWKHHPDEHLLNEYRLREFDREEQVAVGLAELREALGGLSSTPAARTERTFGRQQEER